MKAYALVALACLLTTPAFSQTTPTAKIKATWTVPTTNTDGTPLTDLAGYRVYVRTAPIAVCPPDGDYRPVTVRNPAPTAGQRVSLTFPGLLWNTTYYARVVAVDVAGNLSPCSDEANTVTNQAAPPSGVSVVPAN